MKKREQKTYLTKEEALKKLQRYCAYQDRCHKEVRSKLLDLGVYGPELEEIIVALIQENFLNEERFAQSFVRGKFRMKQWGRNRITRELKARSISPYLIKKGLAEIEEEQYINTLEELLTKKAGLLKEKNIYHRNQKLAQFAIRKGFEPGLTWEKIKELFPIQ